jgi:hypothetical protein
VGYHTEFSGHFEVDKILEPNHRAYLTAFSETRRMKRNSQVALGLKDDIRVSADLPIGDYGEYFVGGGEWRGQAHDASIVDYHSPPPCQPGLWCRWVPTDCGKFLEWDGGEKFYNYVDWLRYIIEHFLIPWGYTLNGCVSWEGEDRNDVGRICVHDNEVGVIYNG